MDSYSGRPPPTPLRDAPRETAVSQNAHSPHRRHDSVPFADFSNYGNSSPVRVSLADGMNCLTAGLAKLIPVAMYIGSCQLNQQQLFTRRKRSGVPEREGHLVVHRLVERPPAFLRRQQFRSPPAVRQSLSGQRAHGECDVRAQPWSSARDDSSAVRRRRSGAVQSDAGIARAASHGGIRPGCVKAIPAIFQAASVLTLRESAGLPGRTRLSRPAESASPYAPSAVFHSSHGGAGSNSPKSGGRGPPRSQTMLLPSQAVKAIDRQRHDLVAYEYLCHLAESVRSSARNAELRHLS